MANNHDKCPFYHGMGKYCSRNASICGGVDKKRFDFRKCRQYIIGVKSA